MTTGGAVFESDDGLKGCLTSSLVLGKPVELGESSLRAIMVDDWQSPSFSPIILTDGQLPNGKVLDAISRYFEQNPTTNSFLDPRPYLLVPKANFDSQPTTYSEALETLGWAVQQDPLSYNRILPPKSWVIPSECYTRVYNTASSALPVKYCDLLKRSFKLSNEQLASFDKVLKSADASTLTFTVNIERTDEIIAGGTVSINGVSATLTWGTVSERHRGKDIHRSLIGGCVSLAASLGAKECWLSTRNPRVREKWDGNYDLFIARPK